MGGCPSSSERAAVPAAGPTRLWHSRVKPVWKKKGTHVPIIEVEHLAKRYGSKVAVDDVSFTVDGGVFGILGPNGAGKTTTVECITGLRSRDGGIVRVLGHDPNRDRRMLQEIPQWIHRPWRFQNPRMGLWWQERD
jgi:ABC-type uncharacterized transport system ATPase subunit